MTFEKWFQDQDFYKNMRFIHGDALFIKDGDIYRVLPVQMAFEAWESRQAEVDQLNKVLDERTKEWLEAIKLGTFFQEAAKPLKDEVDELRKSFDSSQNLSNLRAKTIDSFKEKISDLESKLEEKDKRIESQSNCIENLVVRKSDYLDKVTKAIAHLDSFDHSKASINKLQRSIECALEALRGAHE